MGLKNFAKILINTIPTVKELGVKNGVKHIAKRSTNEIGKVPSIFALAGYSCGWIFTPYIPFSGTAFGICGAIIGKGVENAGKKIIQLMA